MSILALAAAVISGGGGDAVPDAISWADMSGDISATNANQTFSGITATIEVGFSFSGTGTPILTGIVNDGAGSGSPVNISNGDTLRFTASASVTISGTVTVVNNSDGGTVLDTFSLSMTGSIEP